MEGWIKLHRKLLDNPIITKDSDYLAVWIYLLLNTTHKEYDVLFEGKRITLKKGQLLTGRKTISEKLKIDENKVQRILKSLENEQQIEQQTCNRNRLITIVSWNKYQQDEQQNEQQVNNRCTTDEQQVNTNKNDNNVNNIYLYLLNKYSAKIQNANYDHNEKIKIIGECRNSQDYMNLTLEEQNNLFTELMTMNRIGGNK